MAERQVVHSMGRFKWQLAVCGGDVTASCHVPTENGSTYYTTADFGLGDVAYGGDRCSPIEVVLAYCRISGCKESYQQLAPKVEAALEDQRSAKPQRVTP